MKKLFVLTYLILPFLSNAQNVETLKYQADSLRKQGEYKKAEPLYNEAVDLVVNYDEKITDEQWLKLSLAAQQNHIKAYPYTDDKTAVYVSVEYGDDGSKLKEKVKELVRQGTNCIFTWRTRPRGNTIFEIKDPITAALGPGTIDSKQILVWATDKEAFIQEFNSSNVYKPIKIINQPLVKLLINHGDDLAHQNIRYEKTAHTEVAIFDFVFYTPEGVWRKQLHNPQDVAGPAINGSTWLSKLLPLIKAEADAYHHN